MKKGIIKVLGITALVAVGAVGGMALGAEIANGFETTYSESAYEDYGDKKQQIGYEQGKQEGFEAGQIYKDPNKIYIQDFDNGLSFRLVKVDENLSFLSSNSSSVPGLYFICEDRSLINLYGGFSWTFVGTLSNGNVLLSGNVSGTDYYSLVLYDNKVNQVIPVFQRGLSWRILAEFDDNVLLTNGFSDAGIYIFNINTCEVTQLYFTGSSWKFALDLENGTYLIGGSDILLYYKETNSLEIISEEFSAYYYHMIQNNIILLGSDRTNSGVVAYNIDTKQCHKITGSYNQGWNVFYDLPNGNVLITSLTSSYGILLYNISTDEISKIYSSERGWDIFVPDENGVTISSSVNIDQGKVYYDFETGTVTPIEEESESLVV